MGGVLSRERRRPAQPAAEDRGKVWKPSEGFHVNDLKDSRLEMLQTFAEKRPQDPFPRYALGMEIKASGDGDGAWRVFESLIADHADYIAAYAPAGEVLTGLGRLAEARALYGKGIEACTRQSDAHARDHLESAMDALGIEN